MKRKKTIFLIIGCVLAVGFYLFQNMNEKTVKVSKVWELTDEEAANIQMIGLSQDLDIEIKESDSQKNQVILEGKMPKSYAEKINQIDPSENELLISFVNNLGFSMGKLTNDLLKISINLRKESLLEKLMVKSNRGNVDIHVPDNFERKYQLLTNNGDITKPEKAYDVSKIILVELGYGDITVSEN